MVRTVLVACLLCVAVLGNYLFYGHVDAAPPTLRAWLWFPVIGVAGGLLGGAFARAVVEATPRVARLNRRRPYVVAGSLGLGMAVLGVISGGVTYGAGDAQTPGDAARRDAAVHLSACQGGGQLPRPDQRHPGRPVHAQPVGRRRPRRPARVVISDVPRQSVVLLAMAAYFCGVVQSPMTVAIIVVEMTDARWLLVPLLVTTVVAYHASRLLCPVSIYEALAEGFAKRLRAQAETRATG